MKRSRKPLKTQRKVGNPNASRYALQDEDDKTSIQAARNRQRIQHNTKKQGMHASQKLTTLRERVGKELCPKIMKIALLERGSIF